MKQRKMPWHVWTMGALLTWLGSLWPALSSYLAYRIWFSSPRYKESKRESIWRDKAQSEMLNSSGNKKIVIYKWNNSAPDYVLLIHGWSGRGLQMGAFADPITKQARGVISFDAPGHGASEGHQTNIFEIASVVNDIVTKYGTPSAIIAHSFGCMVAPLAISKYQLPVNKLVTISCPTETRYLVAGFARHFKLNEKVMSGFNDRLYKKFGKDIYEKTSAAQNLKGTTAKLLVVHDKDDQIVSWRQSEKLARVIPDTKTYYTTKLGHLRLLRDEKLIQQVMEFLSDRNESE